MKNIDNIRKLPIEEFAKLLKKSHDRCRFCILNHKDCGLCNTTCLDGIKQWLESEVQT